MFKMLCGIPDTYILDITMYEMHFIHVYLYIIETCCPNTIINIIKFRCVWLIHHCIFIALHKGQEPKHGSFFIKENSRFPVQQQNHYLPYHPRWEPLHVYPLSEQPPFSQHTDPTHWVDVAPICYYYVRDPNDHWFLLHMHTAKQRTNTSWK